MLSFPAFIFRISYSGIITSIYTTLLDYMGVCYNLTSKVRRIVYFNRETVKIAT